MAKLFFLFVVFVDQLSKYYIRLNFTEGETLPVFKNIFHITYIKNPGAAFGILPNQQLVFIFMGILISMVVFFFYQKIKCEGKIFLYFAMSFIGGTLGNLIDRIFLGSVIDFLDFRIWPIFNIADIAIVGGVGGIIFLTISKKEEMKNKED